MRHTLPVTIVTVVLTLLAFVAVIWFGQRSLMYFPTSHVPPAADVGLPDAEPVQLQTEDGLDLAAWFVAATPPSSGYTAVVFHGNGGNRADRAPLARGLSRLGIAVLLVDYRGYGGNPGLPSEDGLARDARAALSYVRARPDVDPRRIVFFGESLGTGVAIRLAVDDPPAALILRSPFTSFVEVANHHYPFLPGRWLMRDQYASLGRVAGLRSPTLVIAGDADTIVPAADSRALFDELPEPKYFVTIPDADHNDAALAFGPTVMAAVAAWLQLPRRPADGRLP